MVNNVVAYFHDAGGGVINYPPGNRSQSRRRTILRQGLRRHKFRRRKESSCDYTSEMVLSRRPGRHNPKEND